MKRIYSIDLFKLVFAYIIALGHFGITLAPGSGVTVQIFFIISGFFLAKKFYGKRSHEDGGYNQWNYTLDHVRSLYPHYLFSLLVLVCSQIIKPAIILVTQFDLSQIGVIGRKLYGLIPELVFLQNAGFYEVVNEK